MKQMMTAKLKLHAASAQFQALRKTQLAYRDALNHVSRYAFTHGKKSNQEWLQRETYTDVRTAYHLPAQMACNVPRQVGATYQTLWRVVVGYTGYEKHLALLQQGAHIRAAKLWYDKPRKQFYLLVSLELEIADLTPENHHHVVGVDVGQRYLAVTAQLDNGASFFSGKQVRAKADHYGRLRKRLQHKGTRSATRRLIVISGRERRLKQATNHEISRRIVDQHPHSIIGLEDLTHIRERSRRKHGKKTTRKQRRANRHVSTWAFAELHSFIAFKAMFAGSMVVKVDANYTSQACPICGHTCEGNRPNKGLLFACQSCYYTLHADLIGARNVALRTLLTRQDWMSTGVLEVSPDVSSEEAKAARLSRYAELRWSLDTSTCLRAWCN
jgi:putative transposase